MIGATLTASAALALMGAPPASLPFKGVAPGGLRYTFAVARGPTDTGNRWCSTLETSRTRVIDGMPDRHASCATAPGPRLFGFFDLNCGRGPLFLFGAADRGSGRIRLIPRKGKTVVARRFPVPEEVPIKGTFWFMAVRLRSVPGTLVVERRSGARSERIRFPGKQVYLCGRPGDPRTGEVTGSFGALRIASPPSAD